MPRHSPCALLRFTFRSSEWFYSFCWFSFSDSLCSNKFWRNLRFLHSFNLLKLLATCSFYPTSNWILTLRILFDVVVLWFSSQTRSFLIFALHLLFSFQDTKVLLLSKQIWEEMRDHFFWNLFWKEQSGEFARKTKPWKRESLRSKISRWKRKAQLFIFIGVSWKLNSKCNAKWGNYE